MLRNQKQQSRATALRDARCYSRPCAVRTHPRDSSSIIDLLSLFLFYIILEVATGFRVDHHQSDQELWAQFTEDVR